MRICFVFDGVYPFTKGGVEKRISQVSSYLASRGHDVHVIGTRYWDTTDPVTIGETTYHGLNGSTNLYTKSGKRSSRNAVAFALRLIPPLISEKFDLVETQSTLPLTTLVAWALTRRRNRVLAIYWHEVWESHWLMYAPMTGWVARFLERVCARLDVIHMAPSVTTANKVARLGGRHVEIVPIGIDPRKVTEVPPSSCESDVLYVGRLIEPKNLDLLLAAVEQLAQDSFLPSVLIVGEGPDRERLMQSSAAMNLDRVEFLGRIESDDEVLAIMKASKLLVHPSLREGFGLVVLEAAMCGLPTIAVDSKENAIRELVGPTQLVDPGSPVHLAAKIRELLTSESIRLDLSEHSKSVAQRFAIDRVVGLQEDAYRIHERAPSSLAS